MEKNNKKKLIEAFGREGFEELKEFPPYERAETIVEKMFRGITDKEGKPYLNHLFFVSDQMESEEGKIVGLLHDLIEDTGATLPELQYIGFSETVLSALILLTKTSVVSYEDYIDNIINSNNELAIKVKEADMRNNLDPRRLNNLPAGQAEYFIQKYSEPYQRLKNKKEELENDRYKTNKR